MSWPLRLRSLPNTSSAVGDAVGALRASDGQSGAATLTIVIAAVGAVALDAAESDGAEDRARVVLTVAVLAIVLTAPLGAVLIAVFGPRLLTHDGAADGAGNGEAKELVPGGDAPPEGV